MKQFLEVSAQMTCDHPLTIMWDRSRILIQKYCGLHLTRKVLITYYFFPLQAWVDINCLRTALRPFLSKVSRDFLDEASKPLLDLERPGDSQVVKTCEAEFEERMKFYLYALNAHTVQSLYFRDVVFPHQILSNTLALLLMQYQIWNLFRSI